MSDSESDLLPSNVFTFQNENTTVCAKGPNFNGANYTNLSFQNNVMTSTMHMSRNFGRHHYGEPSCDQRSMHYRRGTSPMSLYSGSDMRGRNQSYYHGGMSSQRSMYNGRSGSPMSMRSIDSNASVSAVDIALAFKNVNFNKHDLRMIKEAYNKFMKRRIRKKIEKRRNMRLFLKGCRRKSGYDSGEQGSDSSMSSDECKSTTSAIYKDNMSSCRSTRTDLTDFRKRIKDSNMYKDCTENFKQNTMRNMFSEPPQNSRDRFNVSSTLTTSTVQNQQGFGQKDRFKNGFLLPSQRFNKSLASLPILERDKLQGSQNTLKPKNHTNNGHMNTQDRVNNETDSDQEEIFTEISVREKNTQNFEHQWDKIINQGKRGLEMEKSSCSSRKRTKLSSPVKQQEANSLLKNGRLAQTQSATLNAKNKINKDNDGSSGVSSKGPRDAKNNNNDFEFIKPQLPVRKSGPGKTKEILISKSAPPLIDTIVPQSIAHIIELKTVPATQTCLSEDKQATSEEQPDVTQNSTTDLSMRPSFIKRKLFSQKMDVTEKKYISNDAINVNSPQSNVYSAIQNEKHKARKLVTNQSCLSRDVVKEDNNLLDLIHKIVPPDRMNVTNATNRTSASTNISNNKNNAVDEDDMWEVTSVISTSNNDKASDTFTDEEIFELDEKKKTSNLRVIKNNYNQNKTEKIKNCKILVEKLPINVVVSSNPLVKVNKEAIVPPEGNDNLKKSVYNCVKSFWDTDLESDVESSMPKRWTSAVKQNQIAVKENYSKNIMEADKTMKNKNTHNVSLASVSDSIKSKTMPTNNIGKLKFNISKHLSIKSFLSPKHKQSKVKDIETVNQQMVVCSKPSSKKEPEDKTKQTNKKTTTTKSKNNVSDSMNEAKKPKISSNVSISKTTLSPNKTITNKTQSTNNNKLTQPPNKNSNKPAQSQKQTKNNRKPTQSPKQTISNKKLAQSPKQTKSNKKLAQSPKQTKSNKKLAQSPKQTKSNKKSAQSPKQTKSNNKPAQSPKQTKSNNKPAQSPKQTKSNNKPAQSPKQTKSNSKPAKSPKQTKSSNKPEQSPQQAKNNNKPAQSKKETKNKTAKSQNTYSTDKSIDNINISARSTRTPKRKACCGDGDTLDHENPVKPVTKSNGHPNKKPKLDDSSPDKVEVANNRTLRSRRNINLSTSINSSTENITTLNLRSLRRTRRVDLTSSLKDSSLDENVTIIKYSRSKAHAKTTSLKPGYAELLDKRQRR